MRGYFDDKPEIERPQRDTELTLGTGAIFGLSFSLVLLCGLCFGAGYEMGHRGTTRSLTATAPTAAPDQEPLQGNSTIPKPSAAETSPAPAPDDSSTAPGAGAIAAAVEPNPEASGQPGSQSGSAPAAMSGVNAAEVRPALPGAANTTSTSQPLPASSVHAAMPAQGQFMVQIAAVANAQDADVLAMALRRHGYSVSAARDPADGLIHVRAGPFASRDEANRWANKLLGDGYNAIVQP